VITAEKSLPAQVTSPAAARRAVREAMTGTGLEVILDDAVLLVSELVTNAVVHAGTQIELHLDIGPRSARVEVIDYRPGPMPALLGEPHDGREAGRGMLLLDVIATEWGTRHFAGGKAVWFTLGVADRVAPRPLPLRVPGRGRPASPPVVSWLLGLPADLEERLSPAQLLGELLHRLCDTMDLQQGWLLAESNQDSQQWSMVARHDPTDLAPEVDEVRRHALAGRDQPLSVGSGLLVLPLRRRTGVFGALVVGDADQLDETEVALARLVGDRMGVLLRDDRAHAAQLRDRRSLALLSEASELFAGTLDVSLLMTLTAQLVVPRFANWTGVYTTDDQGARLVAVAHALETGTAPLRESLASDAARELVQRLVDELRDQPLVVAAHELPAALRGAAGELLAVPLVARGRLLGVMLVGRPPGTGPARDDGALLLDLARRAALAVDNARLYQERTAIAKALQSSLLPPALPTGVHVEFGSRYAAAGEGNEVGGDFYDVFAVPGGLWAVAIGDVCGKGAEAAAITGLARNVLRLLGQDGTPTPAVLRRLNAAILDLGDRGRLCTALMATVRADPSGLLVRLSTAGHPPPVLITADGRASFVGTSGSLLGVFEDIDVPDDEIVLAPDGTLVFYTDGVTERRDGDRMFGDDRLLAACASAAGSSADTFAGLLEEAVRDFGDKASRDDLAILVVRARGA
jgi:sigma-B regulation protein RsbU (phosphoserine phosphatase)